MFIDLLKAVNVIKRPTFTKMLRYLFVLYTSLCHSYGDFIHSFIWSINVYWELTMCCASHSMQGWHKVTETWFLTWLLTSSVGGSGLTLNLPWLCSQIWVVGRHLSFLCPSHFFASGLLLPFIWEPFCSS